MIATTIFCLFFNGLFADYKFLYLATKNISKKSFDKHVENVKNAESRLIHYFYIFNKQTLKIEKYDLYTNF